MSKAVSFFQRARNLHPSPSCGNAVNSAQTVNVDTYQHSEAQILFKLAYIWKLKLYFAEIIVLFMDL
jgi:hypothetical protein